MVRIDDVYQKVLAIANKEQRGYITPQEVNLFADHAQMSIFEQYFYDKNQFARRATEMNIIKLSSDQRTFLWGSNDRKLMNVPFDEHPYTALAHWFKTDEGMEIYSNIEKRLK